MTDITRPLLDRLQIEALLTAEFPQMMGEGHPFVIETVAHLSARVRLRVSAQHLRPGGTVSGPAMFGLADLCAYVAILASIGPELLAVTTSITFNFLQRPEPLDLIADGRIIKLGKRLIVVEIGIGGEDDSGLVAHAVGTYSVPPRKNLRVL